MDHNEKAVKQEEAVDKENKVAKEEEGKHLLVLEKPIDFENNTVTNIDLSCLDNATGEDLVRARRMMNMNGVSLEAYPERTFEFAAALAAVVTGKPVELFNSLGLRDSMRFRSMVTDFLY